MGVDHLPQEDRGQGKPWGQADSPGPQRQGGAHGWVRASLVALALALTSRQA